MSMTTPEGELLIQIQLRVSMHRHVRLFRNNVGTAFVDGRVIQYGVGGKGGSDLIGYQTIEITPDMVGKKIAQFVAMEVKTPSGRVSKEQQHFVQVLSQAGALALVVRSPDDAEKSLSL